MGLGVVLGGGVGQIFLEIVCLIHLSSPSQPLLGSSRNASEKCCVTTLITAAKGTNTPFEVL